MLSNNQKTLLVGSGLTLVFSSGIIIRVGPTLELFTTALIILIAGLNIFTVGIISILLPNKKEKKEVDNG